MALVFQEYSRSLFPWMTVGQNVAFPLRARRWQGRAGGSSRRSPRSACADAMDRYPWQLSGRHAAAGGDRARARLPAEILLMDEPFASVDAQTRADLEDLVLERAPRVRGHDRVRHPRHRRVGLPERPGHMLTPAPTQVGEVLEVGLPRRATRSRRRSCRSSRTCARTSGGRSSGPSARRMRNGRAEPAARLPSATRGRTRRSTTRPTGRRSCATPAPARDDAADADGAHRAAARRRLRGPLDADLTRQHEGEPLGERIIVHGRVLESDGRPVPDSLWRSGSATAPAATSTRVTATPRRWTPTSPAWAAASPTRTVTSASSRSARARTRGATTRTPGAPRTSTSRCSAGRSPSGS